MERNFREGQLEVETNSKPRTLLIVHRWKQGHSMYSTPCLVLDAYGNPPGKRRVVFFWWGRTDHGQSFCWSEAVLAGVAGPLPGC